MTELSFLLSVYCATVGFSFSIVISKAFEMCKDVADAGYKFDSKKLSSFGEKTNPDVRKNSILSMFIPVYNIIDSIKRDILYEQGRHMLFDKLRIMGVLEEMSEYEKKLYQKHPTGLNAVLLPIKMQWKLDRALTIEFPDKSIIYCDKNGDDIIIYKSEGPISYLSEEEQTQRIIDDLTKKYERTTNKSDNIDLPQSGLENVVSKNDGIDSKKARINELKHLKDELLQGQGKVEDKPYGRGRRR